MKESHLIPSIINGFANQGSNIDTIMENVIMGEVWVCGNLMESISTLSNQPVVKPSPQLESMPHATLDLDAFKAEINYHKAHIIIASFIGGKIANGNLAFWL